MIISHKYKFIFVKTIKTAGTSIEVFLSKICGPRDVVTPLFPPVDGHVARNYQKGNFFNHLSARKIRSRISPVIWNNYYKFSVERNPWDKSLSHYYMQKYRERGLSLESYLDRGIFAINFPIYTDASGELIVDRILKYEDLNNELSQVFAKLGIPFDGDLGVRAKSEYRTDRRHYSEVFTKAQADLLQKSFQDEIEMHGYRYQATSF